MGQPHDENCRVLPFAPPGRAGDRALNGKQLNDLYLNTSDTLTYLGVCGGAGRYMVTLTEHHERFAQLLNTQDSSNAQEEQIMCGGQLTRFPRRHLVDLQTRCHRRNALPRHWPGSPHTELGKRQSRIPGGQNATPGLTRPQTSCFFALRALRALHVDPRAQPSVAWYLSGKPAPSGACTRTLETVKDHLKTIHQPSPEP